jgi:ABC-type dipeptide/oligopeptide/nickel transport system ATPase component
MSRTKVRHGRGWRVEAVCRSAVYMAANPESCSRISRRVLGMSVLFITHDLGIVRKIADRVCVMQRGKIVEKGSVERVFKAPEHPYTRALLAAEPKPDPAPPSGRKHPSSSRRKI